MRRSSGDRKVTEQQQALLDSWKARVGISRPYGRAIRKPVPGLIHFLHYVPAGPDQPGIGGVGGPEGIQGLAYTATGKGGFHKFRQLLPVPGQVPFRIQGAGIDLAAFQVGSKHQEGIGEQKIQVFPEVLWQFVHIQVLDFRQQLPVVVGRVEPVITGIVNGVNELLPVILTCPGAAVIPVPVEGLQCLGGQQGGIQNPVGDAGIRSCGRRSRFRGRARWVCLRVSGSRHGKDHTGAGYGGVEQLPGCIHWSFSGTSW